MIKVKDGYAKLIGTTYAGSASRVLLSNGGDHVLGNASGNIPLSNGTVNTNLNSDLLDGLHAGTSNGTVATYTIFPSYTTLINLGFLESDYVDRGHPDELFLKALCKWAINKYSASDPITGSDKATLIGYIGPNSSGTCIIHLYRYQKDSTTLLPRYCRGLYQLLNGDLCLFGTSDYVWSYKKFAYTSEIPNVTNYYWANVKISSVSNTSTSPTFAIATATTSVSTPFLSSPGKLTLNATNTGVDLTFNNDDTKSVILNGTHFKPHDAANGKLNLGSIKARWNNIYASAEIQSTGLNAFRLAYGNYGVIHRNDGTEYYILLTNSGEAITGSWNDLRPFSIVLSTGVVRVRQSLEAHKGISLSNGALHWKESNFGDSFKIQPYFTGTNDLNYLAILSSVGAEGTNPTPTDKLRILGSSGQLQSLVALGIAPFTVTSTTVCPNLNADMLDGVHLAGYGGKAGVMRSWSRGTYTTVKLYFGNGNIVVIDPKPTDDNTLSPNTIIFSLGDSSIRNTLLAFMYERDEIKYRRVVDGPTWGAWRTIAFTDSDISGNAATASLLKSNDTTSVPKGLLFYAGWLPQGNTNNRSWCSPTGNCTNNSVKGEYGSIVRVNYGNTYYNELFFDANSTRPSWRKITGTNSTGWKTLGLLEDIRHSGYVTSSIEGLSSYWGKLWLCTRILNYDDLDITFYIHSAYNLKRGFVHIRVRRNPVTTDGVTTYVNDVNMVQISGNIPTSDIRLYHDATTGKMELWLDVKTRWGVYNANVVSCTQRFGNEVIPIVGTLLSNDFTTVLTLPTYSYITLSNLNSNQVHVLLHTGNNTEYPLVWSNLTNTSNITADLLYKSYSDLTYNPSNKRITAGEYRGTANGAVLYWGDKSEFHLGKNNTTDFYFWSNSTTARLRLGTNGSERLTILANGNVGISNINPSYKLDVNGHTRISGNLLIGKNPTRNYIAFLGTTGDGDGGFNHTYIGENIYYDTESSELVLFKGNDNASNAANPNGTGPDRIRYIAAGHLFQIYKSPVSGTFESVCTSTTPINTLAINAFDVTSYLNVLPSANNTLNLGSSSFKWANIYATTFIGSLSGNASTATNSDKLDGFHETDFFRYRGEIDTAYVDIDVYTSGDSRFKKINPGTYSIPRSGYSEMFISFAKNTGSTSSLEFKTSYSNTEPIYVRKVIDANRVSGAWKQLAFTDSNITGNANTATKLKTARTLTVGNSAKTFDGSANVSWPLHDILYNTTNINSSTSWDIYTPGVYYVASASAFTGTNNPESANGGSSPYRYGLLIVSRANNGGVAQFYISHHDSDTSSNYTPVGIKFRTGWNNSYLTTWRTLLDTHNYSYFLDSRYYTESEINTKLATYLPLAGGTMTGKIYFKVDGSDSVYIGPAIDPNTSTTSYLDFHVRADSADGFRWTTLQYKEGGNVEYVMMKLTGNNSLIATLALTGDFNASGYIKASYADFSYSSYSLLKLTRSGSTNGALITFANNTGILGHIGMTGTATNASLRRYTSDAGTSYVIWDSGNDGSGSGLNADLLDGVHANGLLTALSSNTTNKVSITVGGTTKNITTLYASYLCSVGVVNPLTGRTLAYGNVYSYGTHASAHEGAPTTYTSVIGFGRGTSGTVEIAGEWTSGRGLWARALRDVDDDWYAWDRILTEATYKTVLDSRYYTETEVNNKLAGYLPLAGGTMTGLLTITSGGTHKGIKAGNTYINAIDGNLILQNLSSIRFGGDGWDYDGWAGLKYRHDIKTVYLGLADGTVFNANNNQSGGKLYLPGISDAYIGNGTYKILHANNYNSYSPTLTGGGASGTWSINISGKSNKTSVLDSTRYDSDDLKPNTTVGTTFLFSYISKVWYNVLTMKSYSDNNYTAALLATPAGNPGSDTGYSGNMQWRLGRNSTWLDWKTVLDSSNYTSYTVTKTGGGASGTWGINISGTASKVTVNDLNTTTSYRLVMHNGSTLYSTDGVVCDSKNNSLILNFVAGDLYGHLTHPNPQLCIATESDEIKIVSNSNGDITTNKPDTGANNAAIRKAIDFRWYDTHWQIGNIRGSSSGTRGFGITYGNSTLCFRVTTSGTYSYYNIYAPHFYENSDEQLKTNIQEILNSDKMPIIKEFDWKEDNSHSYGLIALELEEQGYSELVSVKDDGYKTVNYSAALSLIVGKLQVKIKELEKEIENLKNKN